MKHCPNAECESLIRHDVVAEFSDEIEFCSDCGTDLAHGEAPEPDPPVYRELQTIYKAADGISAHIIRFALESDGIPVHIAGEALMGAVGELPATMLEVEIQVPPEFAERARSIALRCEKGVPSDDVDL